MAGPKELLSAVRNYVDITWEDTAADQKLLGIIARGMAYLRRIGGDALDFMEEGLARALLLDYCRYVRSNAFQEFRRDFQGELLALQIDAEVKTHGQPADADL